MQFKWISNEDAAASASAQQVAAEVDDTLLDAYSAALVRAVEAASPFGWSEWVGLTGAVVAIDRFGASAPGPEALAALGITSRAVAEAAKAQGGR